MNWKHGYHADGGYTYGYFPETMPARLRWAALVQGHDAPERGFRYLDAGCGQGLNLLIAAAVHPDSEFVGIDFLPGHIAHANALARAAGIENVRFIEADFVELARDPDSLGRFDYAICHGISSWVAPAVRAALFELLGKVLAPGGLLYNSYNTLPGWLSGMPYQHLVLLEREAGRSGAQAVAAARENLAQLQQSSAALFAAQPSLPARLRKLAEQDPTYLAQEYNNLHWQPVYVTQMMDELADVKLEYLGTATLPEAWDVILSPETRALIARQDSPRVREQLRDYAVNQSFRRDLYVKGSHRPWPGDLRASMLSCRVAAQPMTARPAPGEPYRVSVCVELGGDPELYGALLKVLDDAPEGLSVGELMHHPALDARTRSGALQALSVMLHAGWAVPMLSVEPQARLAARRLNAAMAQAARAGAPYRHLVLPAAAGAHPIADIEWPMLEGAIAQTDPQAWAQAAGAMLAGLQRHLVSDGQAVIDPDKAAAMLRERAELFAKARCPALRVFGTLD